MDDRKIVDLYWARSEQAICETQLKYGRYCLSIASNILPCVCGFCLPHLHNAPDTYSIPACHTTLAMSR